jgi:hypothetical protein
MNPIQTIRRATNPLRQAYRQHLLKRAAARAYEAFVLGCPHAEDALFDDHFLTHRGMAVLQTYLAGYAPSPSALAQACAVQWGNQGENRAAFVQELTPVAARFLRLLERELKRTGTVRSALEPAA